MALQPVVVIILAGQRRGVTNALAQEFGVSHKLLVPMLGKPLIAHVLETLSSIEDIAEIRISVEPEAQEAVEHIAAPLAKDGVPITCHPVREGIVASLQEAAQGEDRPFVITTADNVLMSREAFNQVRYALERADGSIGIAERKAILAAHPEGQLRFYWMRDGGWANCNIFGLASQKAFAGTQLFREDGQFKNNPSRFVRAFGLVNVALMALRVIGSKGAARRMGKRFGITIDAVNLTDGRQAIDVDNRRTFDIVEEVLLRDVKDGEPDFRRV